MKSSTKEMENVATLVANSQTGGDEFYAELQKKAQDAVASIFKSPLYPIQYPSQGDFLWNWQNMNNDFNESTYNYINSVVAPGDITNTAKLGSPGSFPNAYVQILNSIMYSLNTKDQGQLDQATKNASTQGGTVVSDYQTCYGNISAEEMEKVKVKTKLDYIIGYIFGSVWSGKEAAGESPISYTQMTEARNLKKLLPNRPASSDQVISDVSIYLNIMSPVNALQDALQNGSWILTSLKDCTEFPTKKNGGIKTVNPNTGVISDKFNVGYSINKSKQEISNDLQNKGRTIEIKMETHSASGSEMNVHIEGQTGFSVGSWLKFGISGGGSYDMSKAEGTSTDCSVSMKWEGYAMIPMGPAAWQQATEKGWYYADPISQAVANAEKDISGFKFVIKPTFNMDTFKNGGNFGMLNNLLIANYPTVEITYQNANFKKFKESWEEHASGNLTLFGFIKLGSFSQGVYKSSFKESSDNSSFKVTFSASDAIVSVPELQQSAYAIGGAVTNPGA
ncbi:hypothetical protein [Labilibaculum manganireducens]|uniref:Uncharacterized protein n=1 Tax=Labilibaculum manganireducens TaxID=1940525 RepID=A0A2N3IGS7_9BACT|nr:hypothetical protein [Labilibaculum manganireducens]PKQ69515.1 hypothetical protein BZG01_00875 [Labilibaculum manganireducens]